MNVLCRGCRTELDLNASNCPICLRPRDRSEMLEDAKRLREAEAAAKKRPWVLLGWTVAAGVLGWGAWTFRGPVLNALNAVKSKAGDAMETAGDPRTYAPGAAALPAEAPSDAASAAAPSAAPGAAPAAASAPAPAAQEPPAARPLPPHDFTLPPARVNLTETGILMRGWIYDLATARPVPHAVVQLQDRLSGAVHAASAGPDGYYELMLPRENSGLRPAASVAGYRREVLEENDPPWHARKPASRKAAAAREPDEVLLTFAPSQEEALFNLILIPLPEKRR